MDRPVETYLSTLFIKYSIRHLVRMAGYFSANDAMKDSSCGN
jgi:hypothetical protein